METQDNHLRGVTNISDKKYYWLRLKRDFFKRHDIQIIESMPNGKDYVLFYLKLLVESVDHDGTLRFSDTIPYNEQMLSTITNTNIDVVRAAMKVFTELKLIDVFDDQTIYLAETQKMLGTETYWAEQKRRQRIGGQCPENVPLLSNVSNQEIDIDIDKDIDSKGEKSSRFIPPTIEEVTEYCRERNNGVDPVKWWNFYNAKNWYVGKNKMSRWKSAVITWEDKPIETPKQPQKKRKYRQVEINGETVMEEIPNE